MKKNPLIIYKRQVSKGKLIRKINLCSPLQFNQLIQWAFLAARYFSARWINSFSGSSAMLWGHWKVFKPFLLSYTAYKPWCPVLLTCLLTFALPQVFISVPFSSPPGKSDCFSWSYLQFSPASPSCSLSCSGPSLLVSSRFPWSVQVDNTEGRSCQCLHALTGLQALVRHSEGQWVCVLSMGDAAGDWKWKSELLFIFTAC